jgi:hypothetical protein
MQLIFVTGKKQSGKDTSYDFCKSQLGGKSICLCFADPLKDFLIDVFGLSRDQCYGSDEQKNSQTDVRWTDLPFGYKYICELYNKFTDRTVPKNEDTLTARQLMQVFGTEICRKMYQNCWVSATRAKIEKIKDEYDFIFICDARFPNELEFFADMDPVIIRLLRNPYDDKHESEVILDHYNFREKFNRVYYIDNTQMSLSEKNNHVWEILKNEVC